MKFHTKIRESFKPQSFRNSLFTAYAAALLLAAGPAQAAPMYTITDLGQWQPTAINDVGQITGNSFDPVTSESRAVLWSGGALTQLGPSDVIDSFAADINNFGQVVGTARTSTESEGLSSRAVKYIGSSMFNLGVIEGGNSSEAAGINNSGQIVGKSYGYINIDGISVFSPNIPFLHSNGAMNSIGEQIGFYQSNAIGINDLGQIAGNANPQGGYFHDAFLYDSNTASVKIIDPLPGRSRNASSAINNSGQVVGSSYLDILLSPRAFLYDGTSTIDILPPGIGISQALSINDNNQIVGSAHGDTDYGVRSGLFLYENGIVNFWNEMIPENSGWGDLSVGSDINNNGQIVGVGHYGGEQRAFLLTPVDAPPATDIQYININSNGEITGESFNPAYPTAIVTHGWQPEVDDPLSQSFPLSDVSGAVASRALAEGQSLNLITYQWEGAWTGDAGYNAAALGVNEAGLILGSELNSLFNGSGYTGGVHMIGHSLGAAVNAEAVHQFQTLDIDQFTILDAPSDLPVMTVTDFSGQWFHEMLRERQVTYVDNFYGEGVAAFGTSILNAAPGGGLEVAYNHTTIHTEFYSPRIVGGDWVSPIFGLDATSFSDRPGPQFWDQVVLSGLTVAGDLNDFDNWEPTMGFTEISALSELGIGGTDVTNDVVVLVPNSPVSISQHIDIPFDATLLNFDFGFLDPGTGEFLQLFFDDTLLWEIPWMNDLVGELLHAVVPIELLAGLSGDLTFLLDSTTGDAQARAFLTNFEVMGQFVTLVSDVPEPGTWLLLGTGLLGLTRLRTAAPGRTRKMAA